MSTRAKEIYVSYAKISPADITCLESVINWFISNTDTVTRIDCNRSSTTFNKKPVIGDRIKVNHLIGAVNVADFGARRSINLFFRITLYNNNEILDQYKTDLNEIERADLVATEGFNDIALYSDNSNFIYELESNFPTELNDPDFYINLYDLDKDFIEKNLNKQELADYMKSYLYELMTTYDEDDRVSVDLRYDISRKLNDKVQDIMDSQLLPRLKRALDKLDDNLKDSFVEKMSVNLFNKAYKIEE